MARGVTEPSGVPVTAEQITMLATAFNNLRVGALLAGTIVPIVNGQSGQSTKSDAPNAWAPLTRIEKSATLSPFTSPETNVFPPEAA